MLSSHYFFFISLPGYSTYKWNQAPIYILPYSRVLNLIIFFTKQETNTCELTCKAAGLNS